MRGPHPCPMYTVYIDAQKCRWSRTAVYADDPRSDVFDVEGYNAYWFETLSNFLTGYWRKKSVADVSGDGQGVTDNGN